MSTTNLNQERALEFLGQGLGPEVVASALGVTVSYISQLISDENFAASAAKEAQKIQIEMKGYLEKYLS